MLFFSSFFPFGSFDEHKRSTLEDLKMPLHRFIFFLKTKTKTKSTIERDQRPDDAAATHP